MLSLAKLGRFAEEYYLATVADGAEDYYVGRGEAPGHWIGHGSELLGLDGEVTADDLRAVLNGRSPDGEALAASNRTLPGFDLTFSVPKSVSVLAALRPDLDGQITQIAEAAMRRSLEWLEDNACGSRRGKNGTAHVPGDGFVAASFRHRTSRSADPQLHWHVVVANTTRGPDGRWRTLDGTQLYPMARTAGFLFESQLRHDLTEALGVRWTEPKAGLAEIEHFPERLIDLFSKRSQEIDLAMETNGWTSARAAQIAAYTTRAAKQMTDAAPELTKRWQEEARHRAFLQPHHLDAVLGRRRRHQDGEATEARLVGPLGITFHQSTFTKADALRHLSEAMVDGITIDEAVERVDRLLSRVDVVRLGTDAPNRHETIRRADGQLVTSNRVIERYSTTELMEVERQCVELCVRGPGTPSPHLTESQALVALAGHPSLSDDQRALVEGLLTSDRFCDVVVAPAGSGKTFSLNAARQGWEANGYRVIGASLAARAAKELAAQANIRSSTAAALEGDLRSSRNRLDGRTVLVIDEAAMMGTRQMATLLVHAYEAGSKVVLVGDPHQLQSIEAGGLLRGLSDRIDVFELTENRRQRALWERTALAELRDGDTAQFLEAYRKHERITMAPTELGLREQLVADWQRHNADGVADVKILALHRQDIAYFNRTIHLLRKERGEVHGPAVIAGRNEFQLGDEVLTLRNNRRLGLTNGERGTITGIDEHARAITIRTTDGNVRTIPPQYFDDGHLDHGYASTIHKAQGLTTDVALVYGTEDLYREALYTALSRARTHTQLYVTGEPPEREIEQPHAPQPVTIEDEIIEYWTNVSRKATLAIDLPGAAPDLSLA